MTSKPEYEGALEFGMYAAVKLFNKYPKFAMSKSTMDSLETALLMRLVMKGIDEEEIKADVDKIVDEYYKSMERSL